MIARWSKTLIIVLGVYWIWHALMILSATGSIDFRGYSMGSFYLENLLSLYVPPALIGVLIFLRRRKSNA